MACYKGSSADLKAHKRRQAGYGRRVKPEAQGSETPAVLLSAVIATVDPTATMPRERTPSSMLIEVAPELLELILSYLEPRDLTRFGQTCQRANAFVQPDNTLLWRSAFLRVFDDPREAWKLLQPTARDENRERESRWDYYQEIHRRFTAFNALYRSHTTALDPSPKEVVTTLLDVLETATYVKPIGVQARTSLNLDFLESLFRTAPKPERIVHDYQRDMDSVSLPRPLVASPGRPVTRSMIGRSVVVPEWASRFHVSIPTSMKASVDIQEGLSQLL